MVFLIGIIGGTISGIIYAWLTWKMMKMETETKWTLLEQRMMVVFSFIILAFFVGPLISHLYWKQFLLEGPAAIWGFGLSTTLPVAAIVFFRIYQQRKQALLFLIGNGIAIFGICWLIPILYNWILG